MSAPKRAVLVCTITSCGCWANTPDTDPDPDPDCEFCGGSDDVAAHVRARRTGADAEVWVVGPIENEGDAEKLLGQHLECYGDHHRGFCTIIVEGTPLWEGSSLHSHPEWSCGMGATVMVSDLDALERSPNPYVQQDALRTIAGVRRAAQP